MQQHNGLPCVPEGSAIFPATRTLTLSGHFPASIFLFSPFFSGLQKGLPFPTAVTGQLSQTRPDDKAPSHTRSNPPPTPKRDHKQNAGFLLPNLGNSKVNNSDHRGQFSGWCSVQRPGTGPHPSPPFALRLPRQPPVPRARSRRRVATRSSGEPLGASGASALAEVGAEGDGVAEPKWVARHFLGPPKRLGCLLFCFFSVPTPQEGSNPNCSGQSNATVDPPTDPGALYGRMDG